MWYWCPRLGCRCPLIQAAAHAAQAFRYGRADRARPWGWRAVDASEEQNRNITCFSHIVVLSATYVLLCFRQTAFEKLHLFVYVLQLIVLTFNEKLAFLLFLPCLILHVAFSLHTAGKFTQFNLHYRPALPSVPARRQPRLVQSRLEVRFV